MKIGYARVSTGEQKMDLQLDALEEAGCERVYQEEISGAAASRPELERCMSELREGDTLVVWRLDRFGRSLKDLVQKMDALEERGVDFVSVEEGIDTTTAQGRLTFHIFGALAEFERELARERTMAGLRAARERGRVGGRPRALEEEEIPQVQALMKDEEVPVADICGGSRSRRRRCIGTSARKENVDVEPLRIPGCHGFPSTEVGCDYIEKDHPASILQICGDGPHGSANTPGRYE